MRPLLLFLLLIPAVTRAQDLRDLLQRQWKCEMHEGSRIITHHIYNIHIDSMWRVTGLTASRVIDGRQMQSVYASFTGRIVMRPKKKEVMFIYNEGPPTRAENSEKSTWLSESGILYLYRDANDSNKLFLEGDLTSNNGKGIIHTAHKVFR